MEFDNPTAAINSMHKRRAEAEVIKYRKLHHVADVLSSSPQPSISHIDMTPFVVTVRPRDSPKPNRNSGFMPRISSFEGSLAAFVDQTLTRASLVLAENECACSEVPAVHLINTSSDIALAPKSMLLASKTGQLHAYATVTANKSIHEAPVGSYVYFECSMFSRTDDRGSICCGVVSSGTDVHLPVGKADCCVGVHSSGMLLSAGKWTRMSSGPIGLEQCIGVALRCRNAGGLDLAVFVAGKMVQQAVVFDGVQGVTWVPAVSMFAEGTGARCAFDKKDMRYASEAAAQLGERVCTIAGDDV
jgi:hypothetical protein